MVTYRIYIVDDDAALRKGLSFSLEGGAYEVHAFPSGEEALEHARGGAPDLMLLDIGLPGKDGIQVLKEALALHPGLIVIMVTGYEDVATAVQAMKLGAHDYLVKPLHMESIEVVIQKALETIRLRKEVQSLQEERLLENIPFFVGESEAIRDVLEFIAMVARSATTPVLILGETGTGKDLIARAIHFRSPNFSGPMVTVNCAAIPKELIESELFGYEKGAFSGARASGKRGLVQEAENGTLFLDEVGDLSQEGQAKLLRFLEGGEFYRVGSTDKLRVRTRVISATNKDIDGLVERGLFRDDLYYRLGVVKMRVPSLNERPEDVIPLARHFLWEFSREFGRKFDGLSTRAQEALLAHPWRGNIRELRNMVERGVLVGKGGELEAVDLGLEAGAGAGPAAAPPAGTGFAPLAPEGVDFPSLQRSFERFYVEQAFKMAGGNESRAARLLGINHHTFRYHRKKLEIE